MSVAPDSDNYAHPSTSSSSGRELLDAPKPDIKYCKNKKGDFENKIFDWITAETSTSKSPEPEKALDNVDNGLGSISIMIRHNLNVQDRASLLFELQRYSFDFISMRVDMNNPPQQQAPAQLQQPVAVHRIHLCLHRMKVNQRAT